MIECKHERKEFRKLTFSNGNGFHKVLQCLDCGSRLAFNAGNNSIWWPKDPGDEKLPEFDHKAVESAADIRREKEREAREAQAQADRENEILAERARHREYDEYIIRSPEWQKVREKVFKRASRICEACLEAKAIQVHHLNYKSFKKEILYDLRAVCVECHRRIHETMFAPPQPFD